MYVCMYDGILFKDSDAYVPYLILHISGAIQFFVLGHGRFDFVDSHILETSFPLS